MKKLIALSFAACVLAFGATAQTERTVSKTERPQRHKGKHEKGEMMKQLNLSTAQKAQLKAQHKEIKAQRDALKAQDNITVKEMKEKQAALKAEQKSKMDGILTTEQKAKMAELKKQQADKRKDGKVNKEKE